MPRGPQEQSGRRPPPGPRARWREEGGGERKGACACWQCSPGGASGWAGTSSCRRRAEPRT
eukprot:685808-Rhodomonas_salina.1